MGKNEERSQKIVKKGFLKGIHTRWAPYTLSTDKAETVPVQKSLALKIQFFTYFLAPDD
jgi:hypothetical protein